MNLGNGKQNEPIGTCVMFYNYIAFRGQIAIEIKHKTYRSGISGLLN